VQNAAMALIQFLPGLIVVIGVTWFHHRLCRNGLNVWAKSEHLTLLEVRFSWPFQGPDAWRRSRNQTLYRVKVWDARGQILHGWVTLGTYWGWTWYTVSDVTWN
jgi:hypothetical protein